MKKAFLLSVSIVFLSLLVIDSKAQCSGLTPQPSSDWAVSSWGLVDDIPNNEIDIASMQICNMITATPSWSSTNYIFNVPSLYRPYSTKVFTIYGNGGGIILQCTIDPSGNFYVKHISGPLPGRACVLSGSYTR